MPHSKSMTDFMIDNLYQKLNVNLRLIFLILLSFATETL